MTDTLAHAPPRLDPRKFRDPFITAKGEARAHVALKSLDTLWFNTGTLCNLTCQNCYIESSPRNDRLGWLGLDDVRDYLDEIARERNGSLRVVKVNIDDHPLTAQKLGVRGIPTLLLYKGGSIVAQKVGAIGKAELTTFVNQAV